MSQIPTSLCINFSSADKLLVYEKDTIPMKPMTLGSKHKLLKDIDVTFQLQNNKISRMSCGESFDIYIHNICTNA